MKNILLNIVVFVCVTIFLSSTGLAAEWRGIVPLHSARADVERLLGQPTRGSSYAYLYDLQNEVAVVWFQANPCDSEADGGRYGYGWNVPVGTVTSIGAIPKAPRPATAFINVADFRRRDGSGSNLIYFYNADKGLEIEVINGNVTLLRYFPTEAQSDRHCPALERGIRDFFPRFDEYSTLSWRDERARLDNYAETLRGGLGLRGVVVAYGGRCSQANEAQQRAERARRYLVRQGIEAWRVMAIDGGYQENLSVTLNLFSIGGNMSSIYLTPTLDPREVQATTGNRRQGCRRPNSD